MPDLPSPSHGSGESTGTTLTGELYSPAQIAVAAMLGGPVSAGWFVSHNEKQLGRPQNAQLWLWGSVVGFVVLILLTLFLPPHFPRFALAAGYAAGFYAAAQQLYGAAVREQRAVYGPTGSWWTVVWVSFLLLMISFVLIMVVLLLLPRHVIG